MIEGNLVFNNKNTKHKPTIGGKLLFENDIINIPMIPEMAESDLDIDLNVEMRVGKRAVCVEVVREDVIRLTNFPIQHPPANNFVTIGDIACDMDISGHRCAVVSAGIVCLLSYVVGSRGGKGV